MNERRRLGDNLHNRRHQQIVIHNRLITNTLSCPTHEKICKLNCINPICSLPLSPNSYYCLTPSPSPSMMLILPQPTFTYCSTVLTVPIKVVTLPLSFCCPVCPVLSMMTDYNKWNTFNEDEANSEIDRNDRVKAVKEDRRKQLAKVIDSNSDNARMMKSKMEALRSKVGPATMMD